jgi:hypothetical protein
MTGNFGPLEWLRLGVSLASKDPDDDLDEADRPAGVSCAPEKERKRRSRDRSCKKTARRNIYRRPSSHKWR